MEGSNPNEFVWFQLYDGNEDDNGKPLLTALFTAFRQILTLSNEDEINNMRKGMWSNFNVDAALMFVLLMLYNYTENDINLIVILSRVAGERGYYQPLFGRAPKKLPDSPPLFTFWVS